MQNILKTDRLTLRRPSLGDAKTMAALLKEREIINMTASLPCPFISLGAEFWVMMKQADWQRGKSYAYAITQDSGKLMGVMDLFTNKAGDKEIGYWLGKPYWGHGYITEAARAIIKQGFRHFPLPYIDAGYYEDNPASGRVLDKLGFISKNEPSRLYSIARGKPALGIELRLHRKTAMNMINKNDLQATL